ncbi:hypothetical protein ACRAWC_06390 [Leifsonia sp. L25]|uniref:hypothetical protein n=1 Tax=Actinomycetes TaxID=1760 RepID=UPI003D68539A
MAAASPAHAASDPVRGTIGFGNGAYAVPTGAEMEITGWLAPISGSFPADIKLVASFGLDDSGFTVTSGPVVLADSRTFRMTILAPKVTTERSVTLSVESTSHLGYTGATTTLTVLEPGFLEAGYGMVPIATQWRRSARTDLDDTVRWFEPMAVASGAALPVPKANIDQPWLDLRFHLYPSPSANYNNFNNDTFAAAVRTGGFPPPWTDLDTSTEVTIDRYEVNGVPQDASAALTTVLGSSSVRGDGTLAGRATVSACGYMPSVDARGSEFQYTQTKTVYATVPSGFPTGSVAEARIVTSIIRKDGAASKIGFVVRYTY